MNKYIMEFIGTFFLVLVVGLSVSGGAGVLAGLAIGGTLMVMIFAGGHISGGHFNPAVTLACLMRGAISMKDAIPYWVAQMAAGIIAALLASFLAGETYMNPKTGAFGAAVADWAPNAGSFIPGDVNIVKAIISELLFTFALAFTVLNVATSKDHPNNSFYGLAIGFVVVCAAIAAGGISGGAFNPAVGVGHTAITGSQLSLIWLPIVAPLAGGALAAIMFRITNPHEFGSSANAAS